MTRFLPNFLRCAASTVTAGSPSPALSMVEDSTAASLRPANNLHSGDEGTEPHVWSTETLPRRRRPSAPRSEIHSAGLLELSGADREDQIKLSEPFALAFLRKPASSISGIGRELAGQHADMNIRGGPCAGDAAWRRGNCRTA